MKIALTENEIKDYVKIKEEALTYEQSVCLLERIVGLSMVDEAEPINKVIWAVRCAYLLGFAEALDA